MKCIEDEIPFELPEGWEWCRVRDIAAVKGGKRLPKGVGFSPCRTAHAYIRVTDMKNHCINTDDLKYISEEVFLQIKNYTISKDDLYVTIAGTIGVTGEVPTELDGMNLTENAVKITNIQINKNYLCLIIQSEFVQQQFQDKTHQVAMPKLALERILSTLIPVCTITTQSAMVSKFVEMDSLINQIREEKEILAETVSLTKSKILDLAIRGKLVPQNPDDEPASVLLERIRAEKEELIKAGKIKRDKKESIIFKGDDNSYYEKVGAEIRCIDSEIPFEIPDGWMYERLGNICSIARGGSPRPIENYLTDDENGLNWIKIGDTEQGGKYIYSTKEKIRPEGLSKTRYVCSGDFLLTNSMSFGRPYILRTNGCIHDGWLVIGGIEIAFHQDYLYYMLSSSIMYNALSSLAVLHHSIPLNHLITV
ncbi:MAG: restriction endonuclease subunit S [Coprococcus sp.]